MSDDGVVEFDDSAGDEQEENPAASASYDQAVVHATDWTTETIISQLKRGNVTLNPRFQRRDAWTVQQKSKFIESLIMGLPVPQIVLAENKDKRGRYLVLDGKQRLLSLLQFWGLGDGAKNRYALSGLQILTYLNRKKLDDVAHDPGYEADYNALLNQTIRTVVIRNWPDIDFLHLVFLRLNTGSVRLSPQELRQALLPGSYTDWVDEAASKSKPLQELLRLTEPDYRMRDVELLARFMAFRFFLNNYPGRMKRFLDSSFTKLNERWTGLSDKHLEGEGPEAANTESSSALSDFEEGIGVLRHIFGLSEVARKPGSRPFNRALFDMLMFYAQNAQIRAQMGSHVDTVQSAYSTLFEDPKFVAAVDRDTAGLSNTALRLRSWGLALRSALNIDFAVPELVADVSPERIEFAGF